jgi:hypothetical protein
MNTKEILTRLASIIQELNLFFGELSKELPNLRVVVDNSRSLSEQKKMAQRFFLFLVQRSFKKIISKTKI